MKKIFMLITIFSTFSSNSNATESKAAPPSETLLACPTANDLIRALEASTSNIKVQLAQQAKRSSGLARGTKEIIGQAINKGTLTLGPNVNVTQTRNRDGSCVFGVGGGQFLIFKYQ